LFGVRVEIWILKQVSAYRREATTRVRNARRKKELHTQLGWRVFLK
jgi:hypothetical protein